MNYRWIMWIGMLAALVSAAPAQVPRAALPALPAPVPMLTEPLELDLTCIIPTNGPAVDRGELVARLQEYDPRAAGDAAREVAQVKVSGLTHRAGAETVVRFPCTGATAARKAYYVTAVLFPEGAADGDAGIYYLRGVHRVFSLTNAESLCVTLDPVAVEPGEPTN